MVYKKKKDAVIKMQPSTKAKLTERQVTLVDDQITKTEENAIFAKARTDFIIFAMLTGQILTPYYKLYDLHKEAAKILNKVSNEHLYGAAFSTAPQTGKSHIIDIFAAWEIGKYPHLNQTFVTYNEELSIKHIMRTKSIIKSAVYKKIFPAVAIRKGSDSKTEFITTKMGVVRGIGRDSGVSGHTINRLYVDDLVKNIGEIYSETVRKSLDSTVSNLEQRIISGADLQVEEETKVFVIGTRYFADDPVGHFMDEIKINGGIVMNFPAVAFEDIYSPLTKELLWKSGELTLPQRVGEKTIESKKRTYTPDNFNAVYQGIPIKDTENFKKEWIQYITEEELAEMDTVNYLFVDLAVTVNKASDDTGFALGHLNPETGIVYVRAWGEKINPTDVVKRLFDLQDQYNLRMIGMEKMMGSQVIEPFLADEIKRRNRLLRFELIPHNNVAKETRILGALPMLYANGRFKHVQGTDGKLLKQMFAYPKGEHDDVLDSVAGLSTIVGGKKEKKANIGVVVTRPPSQRVSWK